MEKTFLKGKKQYFFVSLYFSDAIMFCLSYALSFFILFGFHASTLDILVPSVRLMLFSLLILLINYSSFKLYRDKRNLFDGNEFMSLLYSGAMTFLILIIFILLFDMYSPFLLFILWLTFALTFILTSISRFLQYQVIYFFRCRGYDKKRVLFFGDRNDDLEQRIKENAVLGYHIVGHTDSIFTLKEKLKGVDIVFLQRDEITEPLMDLIIQNDHVNWKIIPSAFNLVIEPVRFDEFKDYPIINVSQSKVDKASLLAKRATDIALSGLALLLLSPLFMAVAIIIKTTMPGPVFFRQKRLGANMDEFWFYKFRSMVVDAEEKKKELMDKNEVKGLFKMKEDPRITPFGKFLRRTCIDELPQLWNIFQGDMSIVGPRPHLKSELPHFQGWRRERFKIKPGLTGLWQVNGRHEINLDKAILYDIYYIKHMSFLLDVSIILKTIPSIIMSRGRF